MSDHDTAKAIGGCLGVGIAWVLGICVTIVFWAFVIWGVVSLLGVFGVL